MSAEHDAAAERLRAHLPALGIERLAPLGAGDFCLAFAADGDRVVRAARHDRAARALATEACVMARIADALPLAVPRPRFHHLPGAPPFSVHPRIPGVELTAERWHALPTSRRDDAARGVAGFLAALHALPVGEALACGIAPADHAADARTVGDRFRAELRPLLEPGAAEAIVRAFASYRGGGARCSYRPAILHGDFGPDHVLHDPETGLVTGVIDFGDVMVGDPARDFIYVHDDFGPEILTRVLAAYGREPADAILPRVRFHYLCAAVDWALGLRRQGSEDELAEALDEITCEARAWAEAER